LGPSINKGAPPSPYPKSVKSLLGFILTCDVGPLQPSQVVKKAKVPPEPQ